MSAQDPEQRGAGIGRPLLAGFAALVPIVPIVIALLLSSGGGASAGTASGTASSPFKPLEPAAAATAATPPNLLLPPGRGALVAVVAHPTAMRSSPGGHVYTKVPTRTAFGSPQAMWVVRLSGSWLGVVSTLAGNGKVGWIPAKDASLSRSSWRLTVSLSRRQLTVLDNGRVRARYTIAIGSPAAPTPTGRFAVTDRLNTGNPGGPYGCCILALSAKAPHAISDWAGGNRIAIHSTPETWSIGKPVSHGCMRLTLAEGRWLLDHIPLGTPTLVRA
ncbi:MAG TPA: L,D-transpeptidase [Solirubrobacteraceae bacterium]|jgi:lipoprotein-anchoring transpeptidase ErfK/SrfK